MPSGSDDNFMYDLLEKDPLAYEEEKLRRGEAIDPVVQNRINAAKAKQKLLQGAQGVKEKIGGFFGSLNKQDPGQEFNKFLKVPRKDGVQQELDNFNQPQPEPTPEDIERQRKFDAMKIAFDRMNKPRK